MFHLMHLLMTHACTEVPDLRLTFAGVWHDMNDVVGRRSLRVILIEGAQRLVTRLKLRHSVTTRSVLNQLTCVVYNMCYV